MHEGDPIHELEERCVDRLNLEKSPLYSPQLNPFKSLWQHTKHGRLANFAPRTCGSCDGC
jgi:hypothetical protein